MNQRTSKKKSDLLASLRIDHLSSVSYFFKVPGVFDFFSPVTFWSLYFIFILLNNLIIPSIFNGVIYFLYFIEFHASATITSLTGLKLQRAFNLVLICLLSLSYIYKGTWFVLLGSSPLSALF